MENNSTNNATDTQRQFIRRILEMSETRADAPLAYIDTYGCQLNESDSEKLCGMLAAMGYAFTGDEYNADIAIINSCAIRENAENRVFGNTGALLGAKRAHPQQITVFCGCLAAVSTSVERIRSVYKHIDLVFPPGELWRFPELLHSVLTSRGRVFAEDSGAGDIHEGIPVYRKDKLKAWLPVMYGCDNFCSYCIVPYARGRERSRLPESILKEARELAAGGYKDITLLGQNVNSYKGDEAGTPDFPALIRRLDKIDGEFLIRFMTSHPKDASDELFRAMADSGKAARHIHLPFQSGSDRILAKMNRGYTRSEYLGKVAAARSYMPDTVITSDVIAGFPGETADDFERTMELVSAARFDALFTFIYSKRPGTPAASMPESADAGEIKERFGRLAELQNTISAEKHAQYVGKTARVLCDGYSGDERHPISARTNGGRLVRLEGSQDLIGKFTEARITGSNTWSLFGEAVT